MRNNKRSYNKNKRIFKNKTIKNKNKKHKKIKQKGGQHSYAQLKQDIKVLEFYKNKRDGYFVDIGANDGIELSNTYLLEKDYGWKGICVEPLPEQFQELLKNRTSININKAVYNTTGEILDFSSSDFLSGVTKNINTHKHVVLTKPKIKVETITLNDILDKNNAPNFIDYLTLDTEGSELIILNAVNFDKYKFGLIHLEHNHQEPRRSDIKNLLLSKGYKYLGENECDDEYAYEKKLDNFLYNGGSNDNDVCLVITGLLQDNYVNEMIESYKNIRNKIVSTWNDQDKVLIEKLKNNGFIVLTNDYPNIKSSVNVQALSIYYGCMKAKELNFNYVIRIRTDIIVSDINKFIEINLELMKDKLVILYVHNNNSGLYIDDHFIGGSIDKMILFYNVQQESNNIRFPEKFLQEKYMNTTNVTIEKIREYFNFSIEKVYQNNISVKHLKYPERYSGDMIKWFHDRLSRDVLI